MSNDSESRPRRLLLITFHFPPDAEIGAVRPYEIARLFPEHGIEVWVLTVHEQLAERLDTNHEPGVELAERIIRTGVGLTRFDRISRATSVLRGLLRKRRFTA